MQSLPNLLVLGGASRGAGGSAVTLNPVAIFSSKGVMSEHTHKPGLCCGRSDAILAAPGAGGGDRADKKGRGPDTAHRTRAKLDMFMLEQQEASSVPGKLLQSSHCFPSCGDGAWESSSFHHKNNPELSQQLPLHLGP